MPTPLFYALRLEQSMRSHPEQHRMTSVLPHSVFERRDARRQPLRQTMKNRKTNSNSKGVRRRMATTLPIKKTQAIFDEMQQLHDRIMKRAYEIFDGHRHPGRDLENWFRAENELVWKPSIELEEKDNKFLLQVALPGVESKDIEIEVTAEDILVKANIHRERKENKGKVHTSEFTS